MLPYWFSAMTMKSVGEAAMEMVKEVKRQFDTRSRVCWRAPPATPPTTRAASRSPPTRPCARWSRRDPGHGHPHRHRRASSASRPSWDYSPARLVSSVQLAISSSNTGGAWDNAKKYARSTCPRRGASGEIVRNIGDASGVVRQRKGGECHKAAVVGDTVGDPLKDTSGPALNIVMKLMAIISHQQRTSYVPRQEDDARGPFEKRVAAATVFAENNASKNRNNRGLKTIPRVFTSVSLRTALVSRTGTRRGTSVRLFFFVALGALASPLSAAGARHPFSSSSPTLDDAPLPSSPPEVSTTLKFARLRWMARQIVVARARHRVHHGSVAPAFAPGDGDVRSVPPTPPCSVPPTPPPPRPRFASGPASALSRGATTAASTSYPPFRSSASSAAGTSEPIATRRSSFARADIGGGGDAKTSRTRITPGSVGLPAESPP